MTLSARVWATWFVPKLPTRTVAYVALEDSGGPLVCLCFFLLLMIQLVDQPTSAEDTAVDIDRDSAAVDQILLSDRNNLVLHSLSQGW